MPILNRRNSGESRNCRSSRGGGCVSHGPSASLRICPSTMNQVLQFPGQLRIGQSASYYMPHTPHKPLNVSHIAIIVTKGLFVNVAEKVERFDRNIDRKSA